MNRTIFYILPVMAMLVAMHGCASIGRKIRSQTRDEIAERTPAIAVNAAQMVTDERLAQYPTVEDMNAAIETHRKAGEMARATRKRSEAEVLAELWDMSALGKTILGGLALGGLGAGWKSRIMYRAYQKARGKP
jgi:hypothetical protein